MLLLQTMFNIFYRVSNILFSALLVLSLSAPFLKAQSTVVWSQSYGGDQDETFQDIYITDQGGAQVIGYGQSNIGTIKGDKGLYDMIVCEMDKAGQLNWANNIGGSKNDLGKSILIHEGKTFIGGLTYSTDLDVKFNLGSGDIFFGSIDSDQQLANSSLFGGNKLDNIVAIHMHPDGSIILAANTSSTDVNQSGVGGATDIYVCRLLPEGILLWETTIGSDGIDKASDMVVNKQGEIIIVGATFSDNFLEFKKGIKDGFVVCINSEGREIWGKRFGNGNYSGFSACGIDQNNNILITGVQGNINETSSGINGKYNEDIWTLKLSSEGDELWRKMFGGAANDFATDIISSIDGGMLIVGHTESFDGIVNTNLGNKDAFALKLNSSGIREWSQGYGGRGDDQIYAATQDKFGHYWLVGNTSSSDIDLSENNGGIDAWILKLEGEKPQLQIDLGEPVEICAGEPLQIDATLSFCDCQYIWSDGFAGPIRNITAYSDVSLSLTAIDETGNSATDQLDIIVNSAPRFNLNTDAISCADNSDGRVTVTLVSAIPPLQYQWNEGNSSTSTLNDLAAGEYALTLTDGNNCSSSEEIILTEPTPISISSNIKSALCDGNLGAISLEVSGGASPYSLIWSNNETEYNIQNLIAGSYAVTVTDANGCVQEEMYNVNQNSIDFELAFDVIDNLCYAESNGSINILNTNEIAQYSWSTGSSNSSINFLEAGNYILTYVTNDGCSGQQSFSISEPSPLLASSTVIDNACDDANNGSIALEIDGGTSPYSINWTNGQNTSSIFNLGAGNYTANIQDANGCTFVIQEQISTPQSLTLSNIEVSDISCEEAQDGNISISITGGSGSYEYFWSNGATSPSIMNLSAGYYEVSVVDGSGCQSVFDATIQEAPAFPAINTEQISPACFNDANGMISFSTESSSSTLTYLWPDQFVGHQRNDLEAGSYEVTVSTESGCTRVQSVSLDSPSALNMGFIIYKISCAGESDGAVKINASGGVPPYSLSVVNTNSTNIELSENDWIENLSSGTYTIEITDANNCYLSLPVSLQDPDPIVIQGLITDVTCFGEMDGAITALVSGGEGDFQYHWGGNNIENQIDGLRAGIYKVEVLDDNNCHEERAFQVKQPDELIAEHVISNPSTVDDDGIIELIIEGGVAPYMVDWDNGAQGAELDNLSGGDYSYKITDANDCILQGSITLETPTGTNQLQPLAGVSVYPNPVDYLLNINVEGNYDDMYIRLQNNLGQLVYENMHKQFVSGSYTIPVDQLPTGIYHLTLSNSETQGTFKVVVSHP